MSNRINAIARIAHPHPRQGEVTPDESYDDAAIQAQENREDYAENLQVLVDGTDEDALLLALSTAADQRDQAERLIRELLAYGRHFTGGTQPGYSWQTLANAARLPYATARRQVSDGDIAAVRDALGSTNHEPARASGADEDPQ
ncbi:hypothetical protein [Saccharopolyspora endophytica]|uniref:Uncharacterized protein n=1 Tax=Saccharopolyspora endophytica TaxID=543886 RepID=A0ABS5DEA4_9PSEU|nr:hypothetical protein [Saccharopolyspora endophytica]MBQ0924625.1 hypothetical protein [Saccharopolyspora endophytica]